MIKTRKYLKNKENILVTRADKGNSTVIVYKEEYISQMTLMFSDQLLYKVVATDPTARVEDNCNKLITKLQKSECISNYDCLRMKKHNSVCPKAYGLRKTHKGNKVAYRPVISNINAPTYNLSVYIHSIFSLFCSTFDKSVKNSFQAVQTLRNITLPDGYVLISLDVVSLFPSIPKDLLIQMITKHWKFITCYTVLSKDLFIEIVSFIFDNSFFKFNGSFYKQLDGTSMGNPTSPSFANLVMEIIITSVLDRLPFFVPLAMYYVDDTLFAIPKTRINDTVQEFNNFHPRIQFTHEMETNKQIPFLDILVIRSDDGSIITNWYRKPTASGRLLNFLSEHPIYQKINTITNLVSRVKALSDERFMPSNLEIITKLLINNNYPRYFINKVLTNAKKKIPPRRTPDDEDVVKIRCRFPNYPPLSNKISGLFKEEQYVEIVLYNTKTCNSFFSKLKDPEPKENQSELIYKIDCGACSKSYIGMTKQRLKQRISEHKSSCKNYANKGKTALAEHRFSEGHIFDFNSTSILEKEPNYEKRKIAEVIEIILHEDVAINNKKDTENFSSAYYNLLDNYRSVRNIQHKKTTNAHQLQNE